MRDRLKAKSRVAGSKDGLFSKNPILVFGVIKNCPVEYSHILILSKA